MKIQLSDHFTYRKLLRFTLPSVVMMIFTSVYGVVDGLFVSNYVGKIPFSAVNFIMPFLMILSSVGFMFGTGGSALISKTMGEGDYEKANRLFSLFVYVSAACGVVIAVLGYIFVGDVASLLGAKGDMLTNSIIYGRAILLALPFNVLQMEFQSFFITAEKPQLGLTVTVFSGVTNMVLDWLFVAVFRWGLVGAAGATAFSQVIGGAVPLLYFCRKNTSLLKLTGTVFNGRALLKACTNGSSELLSNISMSLVSMLYNVQLMKYAGEDGVASYGVLMYVNFVFLAIFIGYSIGTAPVVGYHYGAGNHAELKSLLKKSLSLIAIFSVCMLGLSEILGGTLSEVFVGYDANLLELTQNGFAIYSFSFLFAGVAVYGSSFFTALNNGPVSALISFLRTLVFQVAAVLILPIFFDINGIWASIVVAELMAFIVTILLLVRKRKQYRY